MATTLDPATLGTNISLSNGNLTATSTGSTQTGARATVARTTGKVYFEYTKGAVAFTGNDFIGVCTPSAVYNQNTAPYGRLACGFFGTGASSVYLNGAALGFSMHGTVTRVGVALDLGNSRVWFRVNGLLWNDSGSNSPSTPSTGVDFSSIAGAGLMAFIETNTNAAGGTFNFGASAFTDAIPSGYTAWDAPAVSAAIGMVLA